MKWRLVVSVQFFGHFGRTVNGTDCPAQSNWPNSELNLRFGSKGGPEYSKKRKFIIYATYP
jgi:hypothetical protein